MIKKIYQNCLLSVMVIAFLVNHTATQNPIVRNPSSADSSARVFGDRVYVYPSHDILDHYNY